MLTGAPFLFVLLRSLNFAEFHADKAVAHGQVAVDDGNGLWMGLLDFVCHDVEEHTFYGFWVRGERDKREPPLTIFLHLDRAAGIVRIIGQN